jgi:predicted HTH transcriptional regulator
VPTAEPSIQPNDSTPIDMPPVAPEAPRDAFTPVLVEDQNGANKAENQISESPVVPAPAPQNSATTQTQSLAQQDEHGFIKSLLIKAQAKIQFNKQKKLEKLIRLAQKKKIITNDDVQKLLRVSDATATRYLVKSVEQGRLSRIGSPRDAKYQFLR